MNPRRILIVEDESIVRLHLSRIIEGMGHHVIGQASSADLALAAAAREPPELVLMDINLRGEKDGVDTASELVRRHGCAVVFATAFADDATIRRTEKAGAVGYVVKPFGEPSVRAAVATALHEFDRRRAVEAKERSLAGIIDSLGEAVVLVDSEMRVRFLNPRAEQLAWFTGSTPQGRPLFEVLRPAGDDLPALRDALDAAREAGRDGALPTVSLQVPGGGDILVNGSIEPLTGGDDGFVVALRDATRRWRTSGRGAGSGGPPRMMIYSHDTFGLGHLRRSLNLAAALTAAVPDLSILLVTGSAMAHRFALPERVDYVKLPAVRKVAAERYSPRSLALPDDDVLSLRTNLLLRTARDFRPDVLLVDHSPAGMRGELQPVLDWLREHHPDCETVIGLRDIIDDPAAVIETWRRQGIFRLLEASYDHIVVYGSRGFYDPVAAYEFPAALAQRVRFVGHVTEETTAEAPGHRAGTPHIVVTTGGGDGAVDEVAGGFLRMLRSGALGRDVTSTVLPGPLAPAESLANLHRLAEGTSAVIEPFVPSTSPHMADADLVICTGGYNTTMQALQHARRILMVPRVMHRQEQLLRATRLAEMGLVRCLRPDEITDVRLADVVNDLLDDPGEALADARRRDLFRFDGAAQMASFCTSLLAPGAAVTEAQND